MGSVVSVFIQTLVDEEVRRIVAEAIAKRGTLKASAAAAQIARVYPNSGVTEREIADRVTRAAAAAGIAVESGLPRHEAA
jgi:hypothetical protein